MIDKPKSVDDLLNAAGVQGAQPYKSVDDLLAAPEFERKVREETGTAGPGVTPEQAAGSGEVNKALGKIGIVTAGSMIPGMATAQYGMIPELAASTAGTFLSSLTADKLMGDTVSIPDATKAAAFNLGGGVISRAAAEAYGALGGIAPQYTRNVAREGLGRGFRLTMREPPSTAELNLGRSIGQAIPTTITEPRQAFTGMLDAATKSGVRVPLDDVITALENSKIRNPQMPESEAFNHLLEDRITALRTTNATKGGMTPVELDNFITKELNPKAFTSSGDVPTTMLGRPYADANQAAVDALLSKLPPEAGALREAVNEELTWRELARKYFSAKRPGKAIVSQVKNIEAPGNEEALQALNYVSKESGIDFVKMARDLATQRAFTADDRVKMAVLNRMMLTFGLGGFATGVATGHPLAGALGMLVNPTSARVLSKVIAPLQDIGGPGGVSLYEYLRQQYAFRGGPEKATTIGPSPVYEQKRIKPREAVIP